MYFVGIDFGHGETTVSRAPGYNGASVSQIALRPANNNEDKKIVSAVCRKDNQWSLVYCPADYKFEDLREGFKGRISEMTAKDKESMREFAKLIFATILKNDTDLEYNSPDDKNFELGIACPSDWIRVDANSQQEYLNFFREECGLPVDHCIKESDAAFFTKFSRYNQSDKVFVIDIGSSTIDFTTYSESKCISSCCWGVNKGAHLIEDALMPHILGIPQNRENVARLIQFKANNRLIDNVGAACLLYTRYFKEQFYTNNADNFIVRMAFLDLAKGWNGDEWENCIQYRVTRDEFNDIIASYKTLIYETLQNAKIKLNTNGIVPNRILLSGGASRMSFIQEYAEQIFGVKVDVDPQPECVVSHGVALYAKAHSKAEECVIGPLSAIDYTELYKNADREATYKATQELFPSVLREIDGVSDLTGWDMFQKIASFFLGLNSSNQDYRRILNQSVKEYINSTVASYIKEAIRDAYRLNVDTSDVNVEVEAQVMDYQFEFFSEGPAGRKIMELLSDATGPHIFSPFDIDKPRSSSVRHVVAQICRERLCVCDPFEVGYNADDLRTVADEIKTQCLSEARKILHDKQLFDMTFKQ